VQAIARLHEVELATTFYETGCRSHRHRIYIKVKGRWVYLYRAVDRDGTLVDVYLGRKAQLCGIVR
jgi:transposase-like protein